MSAYNDLLNRYEPRPADASAHFRQLLDAVVAETRAEDADAIVNAFHGEPFLNYPPDFADLLRQKIDAKDSPDTGDALFFQSGHLYAREHHGARIEFHVSHVGVAPDGAKYTAFGWRTDPYSGWEPFDADDLTGWVDVTEEVAW